MVHPLDLYPLTFDEFLAATDEGLYQYYSEIKKEQPIDPIDPIEIPYLDKIKRKH